MRYSQFELKKRAEWILGGLAEGDERCFQVVLTVAMRTGLHPNEVTKRLEAMTHG